LTRKLCEIVFVRFSCTASHNVAYWRATLGPALDESLAERLLRKCMDRCRSRQRVKAQHFPKHNSKPCIELIVAGAPEDFWATASFDIIDLVILLAGVVLRTMLSDLESCRRLTMAVSEARVRSVVGRLACDLGCAGGGCRASQALI
jgi:hypothetical protein